MAGLELRANNLSGRFVFIELLKAPHPSAGISPPQTLQADRCGYCLLAGGNIPEYTDNVCMSSSVLS